MTAAGQDDARAYLASGATAFGSLCDHIGATIIHALNQLLVPRAQAVCTA